MAKLSKLEARHRRHRRLRGKVAGTAEVPRMAVCTTANHIYVQFINDDLGRTLAAVSTIEPQLKADRVKPNKQGAELLGKTAAERAKAAGIRRVVFDRGGFRYHGRIKVLADAARAAGLEF
jgi:large subunit ribosomal protein L18